MSDSCWFVLTRVRLVLIRVDSCLNRVDSCWTRVDSCWIVSESCWFVLDLCWLVLIRVDLCWHSCIKKDMIKNKPEPYQCISDQRAKLTTFLIWPRGTLENIFKVESFAQLNIWGNVKKLVIVKLSVKHKVKWFKIPPNLKLSRGVTVNPFKT